MSTAFGARLSCRTKKPSHAGRAQNTLQDRHPVLTALGSSTLRPLRKAHVLAMQQLARKKNNETVKLGFVLPSSLKIWLANSAICTQYICCQETQERLQQT